MKSARGSARRAQRLVKINVANIDEKINQRDNVRK
jgi:hypothetical protein